MASFGVVRLEHEYETFSSELPIALPGSEDATVRLYGRPGRTNGLSLHDLRLYFDQVDVTSAYTQLLSDQVNARQPDAVSAAYARGMDQWLQRARTLTLRHPFMFGVRDDETDTKNRLLAARPFGSLLFTNPRDPRSARLGDADVGWGGSLHLFNYLYTYIDVEPISLVAVRNRYLADNPSATVPTVRDMKRFTLSNGPSDYLNAAYTKKDSRGVVGVSIDFKSSELEAKLNEILRIVSSEGPIQKNGTAVLSKLLVIQSELEDCSLQVGDHNNITAVLASLAEIKRKLGISTTPAAAPGAHK